MNGTYIESIEIRKVRHLKNIEIPISKNGLKHLIITGKNGSGKTSLLEAICNNLNYIVSNKYDTLEEINHMIAYYKDQIENLSDSEKDKNKKEHYLKGLKVENDKLLNWTEGAIAKFSSNMEFREKYLKGKIILAYYGADRVLKTETYKNIEKVELKNIYAPSDNPGTKITKYMVDLKARQAFSEAGSEDQVGIERWFDNFENMLKQIFNDDSVRLVFDKNTFQFSIHQDGKEAFDFNTLSSGYAAIFKIISDLIMRMEAESQVRNTFEMEGIVLIDEIETHLHIELQKNILTILTTFFPNIQFIVTTHSPYILNSIENAKVYDLEKRIELENLTGYSVETLGEGYFGEDEYAEVLKNELYRYQNLCEKVDITEDERAERAEIRNKWKNMKYPVGTEFYQMFMEIEDRRKANG